MVDLLSGNVNAKKLPRKSDIEAPDGTAPNPGGLSSMRICGSGFHSSGVAVDINGRF
jgi:hypothetical protein